MQELQSFEWQLSQSPIMSVLFTPETVPLAWPSKLNSRTYLTPFIASPQRLPNNAIIPKRNLRQSYDTSKSDEFSGVTNPPNYLDMQLPIKNSPQQPSLEIQKKKPYISPSLRVNKIVQNTDEIDVRMDKISDEKLYSIPNQMINRTPLDSLQVFDENSETEDETSKMIQQNSTPSEQKNKETAKRQFAVSVLHQEQKNDIQNGESNIDKENKFELLNSEKNSNVQLPIINQVEEKHIQTNFQDIQDIKTASTETNGEGKTETVSNIDY